MPHKEDFFQYLIRLLNVQSVLDKSDRKSNIRVQFNQKIRAQTIRKSTSGFHFIEKKQLVAIFLGRLFGLAAEQLVLGQADALL